MARLVLLSFKGSKDAEDFARAMVGEEGDPAERDLILADYLLSGAVSLAKAKVEWVIGRPTEHCQCGPSRGTVKRRRGKTVGRTDGWTKGRTYGFWIHPVKGCGRVSRLVKERFVAHITGGAYDLLPEILEDPERVPNDLRQFATYGDPNAL